MSWGFRQFFAPSSAACGPETSTQFHLVEKLRSPARTVVSQGVKYIDPPELMTVLLGLPDNVALAKMSSTILLVLSKAHAVPFYTPLRETS